MKNFIRGMGVGIILATIVLALTYMVDGDNISDEEIKRRAAKLGMVEESTSIFGTDQAKGADDTEKTPQSTERAEDEKTPQSPEKAEDEQTPQGTERTEDEQTPQGTERADAGVNKDKVKVKIVKGEDGIRISQKLADAGVVDNAAKFNKYLSKNYLQMDIMYGTYELEKNMSYEEVARQIVVK